MKKTILIMLLAMSQASWSERLVFANNQEGVEIDGNAQIDFQTGDIIVNTVGDHLIVEDTGAIVSFYPSDYDIEVGQTVDVNWTTVFAGSCTADVTSGNANWSGNKASNDGSHSQNNVTVSQLPTTFELDCTNVGGGNVVRSFQVTEQTGGGGGGGGGGSSDPEITLFRVNGLNNSAVISPPGTATVTWSASNVSSCNASSNPTVPGWNENGLSASGSTQITVTQNTQLTLTCDTDVANFTITYSNTSGCDSSVYPTGLNIQTFDYLELNDDFQFGESTNTDVLVNLAITTFGALTPFTAPNDSNFRRRLDFISPPTNSNKNEFATASISTCPGDFSETAVCVKDARPFRNMRISTNQSDSPTTYCILQPGETYYLNLINSPDPYNVAPSCLNNSHTTCAIFYTETAL